MNDQPYARKIKTQYRRHLFQKWKTYSNHRFLYQCVNNEDFLDLKPINQIPPSQLACIKDETSKKWFAFSLDSFYCYLTTHLPQTHQCHQTITNKTNPYTRTPISSKQIKHFLKAIKYYLLIQPWTQFPILSQAHAFQETFLPQFSPLPFDRRLEKIICKLNWLENTDVSYDFYENNQTKTIRSHWWTTLKSNQWILFYLTLLKIWDTRIDALTQTHICPHMPIYAQRIPVKKGPAYALEICENLIFSDVEQHYQQIGCSIILSAISMIHPDAKKDLYYYRDTWI